MDTENKKWKYIVAGAVVVAAVVSFSWSTATIGANQINLIYLLLNAVVAILAILFAYVMLTRR